MKTKETEKSTQTITAVSYTHLDVYKRQAAFLYAVYGVTIGTLVTWYTMNHDWPQNIGGKPAFLWAHNMPCLLYTSRCV